MKIYPIRLLKALVYAGASFFFIFHEYGTNSLGAKQRWTPVVEAWAEEIGGVIGGAVSFLWFVVGVASLIYLVKGVFYFFTLGVKTVPAIEVSLRELFRKPCSGYDSEESNIDRIKRYRDIKMGTRMNSEAAKEYKSTAWLDGLTSDGGTHTKTVRRYIDASLACKTNEQGYEWLKKNE